MRQRRREGEEREERGRREGDKRGRREGDRSEGRKEGGNVESTRR